MTYVCSKVYNYSHELFRFSDARSLTLLTSVVPPFTYWKKEFRFNLSIKIVSKIESEVIY